jgi:hypothetical protein
MVVLGHFCVLLHSLVVTENLTMRTSGFTEELFMLYAFD